jgi:hypothetical protein
MNSDQEIKFEVVIEDLHDMQDSAAGLVCHLNVVAILNVLQDYLVHLIKY